MSGITTISKEAGVLRILLQKGSINLKELDQFLGKVENFSPPIPKKKSADRFNDQLLNLDSRRAKKVKVQCRQ